MKRMKQNMPEYITVLSNNNYDVFEEIFLDKYEKFIELFWLIKNFQKTTINIKL